MKGAASALPFHDGRPVAIGDAGWLVLLLAVAAGFAALLLVPSAHWAGQLAGRLLFAGLPLLALLVLTGRHAGALFGRFGAREAGLTVLAWVLSVMAAVCAALLVERIAPVASNPLFVHARELTGPMLVASLLSMAPQLLGEELLTVLPLLAILRLGAGHRAAVPLAVLGSTLVFCAVHLPTYQWNWLQCFGVIGASRLVLTWAYLRSGSLWVCTGAHVLTDWSEVTLAWLAAQD